MDKSAETERLTRRIIWAFLGVVFCLSVVVLAAQRYKLSFDWLWKPEEDRIFRALTEESEWEYMDAGMEPGVGNVWTTSTYVPEAWKSGKGRFSEAGAASAEEADVLLDSRSPEGAYSPTYFFRSEFRIGSVDWVQSIAGSIRYSDAVLVYLNGRIIFAGNVPEDGYRSNQDVGCAMDDGEIRVHDFVVTDLSALRSGTNILAVEVHRADTSREQAYFELPYFNLLGGEAEELAPNLQNVFLEQGENESQLHVNWLTSSGDFYEVLYITEADYERYMEYLDRMAGTEDLDVFLQIADLVLMGRTYSAERGRYLNRASLTRLRTGETYLYQIRKVGSAAHSETLRFVAGRNTQYTFAAFADSFEWISSGYEAGHAPGQMSRLDFVLSDQSFAVSGPALLKSVPIVMLRGGGDYYFTYQDSLFIVLDPEQGSLARHRAFMEDAKRQAQRKWVIVSMYPSVDAAAGYEQMLSAVGVDMVVSISGDAYVRDHLSNGGALFVNAGADGAHGVFINVTKDTLRLTAVNLAGERTDEYSISK